MGGGGSSGPTLQQQELQTQQALTTANLNLEENSQRKVILNALQGTRVFRGSALSRSVVGDNDNPGSAENTGAPSASQVNSYDQITAAPATSLLDTVARGATSGGSSGSAGNGGNSGSGRAGGGGGGVHK